jgi:hypothetical protein
MGMKPFWIVPLFAGAMLAAAPMMSAAQDNPKPAATSPVKGPPRQYRANETPE